jgi:hypothetical protein
MARKYVGDILSALKRYRRLDMPHYKDVDRIPWNSLGRETVAFKVGRSIVPVGIYPFDLVPFSSPTGIETVA